jgi:hypothetical protein
MLHSFFNFHRNLWGVFQNFVKVSNITQKNIIQHIKLSELIS